MNSVFSVAVHALVYLNHKGKSLNSEALAKNICTHPARVRRVMAKLKRAGFLETREGLEGGYRFVGDADSLTLAQVARALDVRFVEAAWRSGDTDMECLVASGMADIMDEIYAAMDGMCQRELEGVTIAHIDRRIFGDGKEKLL